MTQEKLDAQNKSQGGELPQSELFNQVKKQNTVYIPEASTWPVPVITSTVYGLKSLKYLSGPLLKKIASSFQNMFDG